MTQETMSQRSRVRFLLDAIERPAWVIRSDGSVYLRNVPAREIPEMPSWIRGAIADESTPLPHGARLRHVYIDGESYRIAIAPASPGSPSFDFAALGLDEGQVELAEHMLRGFSDVEIALVSGKPIASVQASIVQIHRSLGVRTRSELAAFVHRARHETAPPVASRAIQPTVQMRSGIRESIREIPKIILK